MLTQLFQARAMCFVTVAYGSPIIFTLDKLFLKLIKPTSPQGQVDIDLYFHHFLSDVDSKWVCLKIVYLIFQWIITMFPMKIAMNVGIPYFQTNRNGGFLKLGYRRVRVQSAGLLAIPGGL